MKRREFLKTSALASTALMIPGFMNAQFDPLNVVGKRLIVLQLSGGNDGLNTVVPYKNDLYYQNRPVLGLSKSKLNVVSDGVGFHPALKEMAKMFENGDLLTINGVGYPDPNRSHFRSMDIWHSASDSDKYLQSGWLGRFMDHTCAAGCDNPMAIEIDQSLGLALKGEQQKALAIQNIRQFSRMSKSKLNQLALSHHQHEHDHNNHAYLYKTLRQTVNASDYIEDKMSRVPQMNHFPVNQLGKQLKTIAQMIAAGLDTSVYYASITGFDTHVNQLQAHERQLKQVDAALSALVKSLKEQHVWNDTLIMVFSEFGRRVKENGSRGTDHGSGNQVFLLSGGLKQQGFYNAMPDLSKLQDGDIAMQMDFRRIYASILKDWFNSPDELILGGKFNSLNIF